MSEAPQPMTLEEKLDEALKGTFPASDAFWLAPENALPAPTKKAVA
jgi:hypothetical protein